MNLALAKDVFLPSYIKGVKPRERLTVSKWADSNRILTSISSNETGLWRTSRTPYLKEPMDCLSLASPISKVVLMFPAQVGKTECSLNWLGYIMDHAAAPVMVVLPDLQVRDKWVKQRLEPMLKETTVLAKMLGQLKSRDSSNTQSIKEFPGGIMVLGGANSEASLSSMPIKYIIADELDQFAWTLRRGSDPLNLVQERQNNFPTRKILLISTPTIQDASRIEEAYEDSDQRRYYVPCPSCEETQPLVWNNLRWNQQLTDCWYVCECCGHNITENHKTSMLARGYWQSQNPDADPTTRGYHLNALYSPIGLGLRWLDLAKQWVKVQGSPKDHQDFTNLKLAETWQDRSHAVKPKHLQELAESWACRTVPEGALVLTAGVDVQKNRLALQILGHGRHNQTYTIDYIEIPGDPERPEVWMALAEKLNTPLENIYGRRMVIQATAIDSGYLTNDVYCFVRSRGARRLMAIKGKNSPGGLLLAARPSKQDVTVRGKVVKGGVDLWLVSGDTGKHTLYGRIEKDREASANHRFLHFNEDLDEDYYSMLTAETLDHRTNKWVLRKGRRAEALDTWIYALAASYHPQIRVNAMRVRDWDELARLLGPTPEPTETPKEPEQETPVYQRPSRQNTSRGRKKNFATDFMR